MAMNNKTQFQNLASGGLFAVKDLSWVRENEGQRPGERNSAGFQCLRLVQTDYDKDTRLTKFDKDDDKDTKIGIFEPNAIVFRLHEKNEATAEDVPSDATQSNAQAGVANLEGSGRRTPHSKVFSLGLITDDKHWYNTDLNRSSPITRMSDYQGADLASMFQVREILGDISQMTQSQIEAATAGIIGTTITDTFLHPQPVDGKFAEPAFNNTYRPMIQINTEQNKEGGYVWRGTGNLGAKANIDDNLEPVAGYYAQWGDVFIISTDDVYKTTERDKESRSLLNIRHDAHFHYNSSFDGRLYLVPSDAALLTEGTGTRFKGDIWLDSTLANTDTQFNKESGEWRPVFRLPAIVYESSPSDNYTMSASILINNPYDSVTLAVNGAYGSTLNIVEFGIDNAIGIDNASGNCSASVVIDANGYIGIGTTGPDYHTHIYASADTPIGINIEQDGAGDAIVRLVLSDTLEWQVGIDNDDSDSFKISNGDLGVSSDYFIIDTDGNVYINNGSLNLNNPDDTLTLKVNGAYDSAANIAEFGVDNASGVCSASIVFDANGYATFTNGILAQTTVITSADSPYTVSTSDEVLYCNTDGAITVNLPAGIDGATYRIINTGSSGNAVTLTPNGAENLRGSNSSLTLLDGDVLIVTYETTEEWW